MRTATSLAVLLLAAAPAARATEDVLAAPGTLASVGKHCFGEARPRWLAATALVGALNPRGLELQLQAGRCLPLITAPGALFDYTNFQYGLTAYLTPVYAMPGAFVSIAPLSVIELRVEAEYVAQWPIGIDAAGYFPLSGYDAPWSSLPADLAEPARGYTVNFIANLQAELPLARGWSLLAVDAVSYQFWQLGDAPYYFNARNDLPMARREWLLKNTALVLLSRSLSDRVMLRAGLTDDLTRVQGSGYLQNVLGVLLTGVIARWPGERSETQPFLRLGGYTAHQYKQGEFQLLAGVGMTFNLTPVPAR